MFHEVIKNGIDDPDCKNNFTMPHFVDIIQILKTFETTFPNVSNGLFSKNKYKKGDILLHEGDYAKEFYFVEKGIVRSYSMIDNKERTIQLAFPSEFSGAYSNSILGVKSDVTIEVLANSIIWVFRWDKWDESKNEYPELVLFERINSASYIMSLNERINDLLFLSTYERYEKLLNKRPQVIKRLPLKYIADYLGCTIENISRIRAKLSK